MSAGDDFYRAGVISTAGFLFTQAAPTSVLLAWLCGVIFAFSISFTFHLFFLLALVHDQRGKIRLCIAASYIVNIYSLLALFLPTLSVMKRIGPELQIQLSSMFANYANWAISVLICTIFAITVLVLALIHTTMSGLAVILYNNQKCRHFEVLAYDDTPIDQNMPSQPPLIQACESETSTRSLKTL